MRKQIPDKNTRQKVHVDREGESVDEFSQWIGQDEADTSPPDLSVRQRAGSDNGSLFSFIREAHLQEAQEFRRKGYNSQVPEVDPRLVTQLREALAAAKSRLCLQAHVRGPLGSLWLQQQMGQIEHFTGRFSGGRMQGWVNHELASKSRGQSGDNSLGSRRMAQSLVRRLESTLQTLIRVIHILRAIDSYSTPEKRRDLLVAELTGAFFSSDDNTVMQALGRMTAEVAGNAAWSSLMQARAAAWEAERPTTIRAMIETTRHEAEKANKKARELRGASQALFRDIAAYLQSLSGDFAKASINASQSTSPWIMPHVNDDDIAMPLSRSSPLSLRFKMDLAKKKEQGQVVLSVAKRYAYRSARIIRHGHTTKTPSKEPEHVIADSIIRSILWQWQQLAIKIQYASAALLSKVDELQKIEGMFLSDAVAHDRGNEQEGSDVSVSQPCEEDMDAQVRQWVNDRLEQEKPENQRAEKLAVLSQLLDIDIDHAQTILTRLGNTTESIQKVLERQWLDVNDMVEERFSVDVAHFLWATVDEMVVKFMPDLAKDLAAAAEELNNALLAAGNSARNFSEARTQADKAQLLATKVKESISAESARLTERPLDEHSRGSRLAKHWANLAKEQSLSNYPPLDAEQVFSSLKKQGLLAGTLSTGDPGGYLFATRLAGELENARNDELRLPMSPEQYAALEKGLVEYIVKWGQRRISRGLTRIVIELSFEQVLDTVTFNVSNLFRMPYKIIKASIKVPYNVNKVNNYTMPGHDKPYKAIYGLLGKKLKQLGFNLMTAPVPGVVKLVAGTEVSAGVILHNKHVESKENTISAVYQRVAEGNGSEKIKMDSLGGMIRDSVVDSAITAAFKGTSRALRRVSHPSPLQQKTDVKLSSDKREPSSDQASIRRKREVANVAPPPSHKWHHNIPADAKLQSEHFDVDHGIRYQSLSDVQKKQTYLHAIQFVLLKIENDESLPEKIRHEAYNARIGAHNVVTVDIEAYRLNNTFLIPDSPGSQTGVLVRLGSELPYYYIREGKDLSEDIKWAMPYEAYQTDRRIANYRHAFSNGINPATRGIEVLNRIRNGALKYNKYFNANNPNPMDIGSLSTLLANTIEADYNSKKMTIENKNLIHRAIAGAHIPESEVRITEEKYRLEITWERLTTAEYLKSFERPFATLSGEMQLISSSNKGETLQETELHVHQAEYIGSWLDATVGAITSLTPEGWVLNTAQSAAGIVADLTEGKDPDPLAVAGLILGCIPGGRIAAKVGKLTQIGGKVIKYGFMIGNKVVDLAIVGKSIKTAVETGEPLAIYQALLASGMSVKNSYDMTKSISSAINFRRSLEESASLEELEAINNNAPEYSLSPTISERTFRVGATEMHGKINNGEIEISLDNGETWKPGNKLHLLAYRLQNAGGISDIFSKKIVIGEHSFKYVKYDKNKLKEMKRIADTYTKIREKPSTERIERRQQDYIYGKQASNAVQYDEYNALSFNDKLELFIKDDTDTRIKGVLDVKINEDIKDINLYETAKGIKSWEASANKATDVVLAPQDIYLKGRTGECLPLVVLMGWALQSGQDKKLLKNLMDMYSCSDIGTEPLYNDLLVLHSDGNSSKFNGPEISNVNIDTLKNAESELFPTENSFVRFNSSKHVVLLSKVNNEGKIQYDFYDPNYGVAYFKKYKDMVAFFKKKIAVYGWQEGAIKLFRLDYSRALDIKVNRKDLNEIINGGIPKVYREEDVNLEGITPREGFYCPPGHLLVDKPYRHGDRSYIKVNDSFYQVDFDSMIDSWRVIDPREANWNKEAIPVKRNTDGEWVIRTDIKKINITRAPDMPGTSTQGGM